MVTLESSMRNAALNRSQDVELMVKIAQESGFLENLYNNASGRIGSFFRDTNFKDPNNYIMPALGLATYVGLPWLIKKVLKNTNIKMRRRMNDILRKIPKGVNNNELINKIKERSKLSDVPHSIINGYNNASYIGHGIIGEKEEVDLKDQADRLLKSKKDEDKSTGQMILKSIEYSKRPNGGIIIGDQLNNPVVMAHELGHAEIMKNRTWEKYIPKVGGIMRSLGTPMMVSGLVTKLFLPDLANKLFVTGVALSSAGHLGKMYHEYNASSIGKGLFEQGELDKKRKKLLDYGLVGYGLPGAEEVSSNFSKFLGLSMI